MAGYQPVDQGSGMFDSYSDEFVQLHKSTSDAIRQLSNGSTPPEVQPEKIKQTATDLGEMSGLLQQMEMEVRDKPKAVRAQLSGQVADFRSQTRDLQKKFRAAKEVTEPIAPPSPHRTQTHDKRTDGRTEQSSSIYAH